jgi:hypothetical protein
MRIDELTQSPAAAGRSGADAVLTPLDAGLEDDEEEDDDE